MSDAILAIILVLLVSAIRRFGGLVSGLWVGASSIGAAVGVAVAGNNFSYASFSQTPTGQFTYHLVLSSTVGLFFAVAQGIALVLLTTGKSNEKAFLFLLWFGASTVGITAMILPMWSADTYALVMAFFLAFVPMLPGIALLAILQWLVLKILFLASISWIAHTFAGAVLGATSGILAAIFMLEYGLPFEITWAAVTAGFIGLFQSSEHRQLLNEPPQRS